MVLFILEPTWEPCRDVINKSRQTTCGNIHSAIHTSTIGVNHKDRAEKRNLEESDCLGRQDWL